MDDGDSVRNLPIVDAVYDGGGTCPEDNIFVPPDDSDGKLRNSAARSDLRSERQSYNRDMTRAPVFRTTRLSHTKTGLHPHQHGAGRDDPFQYDPTFVYTKEVDYPTPSSGVAISQKASYETSYTGLLQSSPIPTIRSAR